MTNFIKFSQFVVSAQGDSTTEVVGLASGANIRTPKTTTWTTATRPGTVLNPVPPYDGLLGFNTTLEQYEFWSATLSLWIQLASSVALAETFIVRLPSPALPNSFALSTLTTGILKSTTGTGTLSISPSLTSIDSLVTVADQIIYTTAPDTYATTSLTTFSRGLLADVSALAWRTSLGVPGIPVSVSEGGTGNNSFTPFSVICAGTVATNPFQNVVGVGVAGQALTSNGPGLLPTWQSPASSGTVNPGLINELAYYAANGTAVSGLLTANDGVLITSPAGVPSISSTIPLVTQLNITQLGTITTGTWNGSIIDLAHGGTNANLVASAGSIVYSTVAAMALSAVGTSGQLLQSNGALAPSWTTAGFPSGPGSAGEILRSDGTNWVPSTSTFADTYGASELLYSNGANTVQGLATAVDATLITSGAGVPSLSQTLPSAVQLNITSLGTVTAGTWNASTIDVAHGGTGDTSFTAYSVICGGIGATNPLQNVVGLGAIGQVLTSAGPGALPTWQNAAGTGTVNSGNINEIAWYAANGNTISGLPTAIEGLLTTDSGGAPHILAGPGVTGKILQSNSGAAPSFSTATYPSIATSAGTILRANGTNWLASTSTFADTYAANSILYASSANTVVGLATSASAVLTTVASVPTWASQLSLALGGTNANLTADNGGIVYSTASALAILAHTTTAGLALLSGNATAPTWSTSPPITQINTQRITTTGAGTFTPTTGMKYCIIELQGGGGGSGGTTGAGGHGAVSGGGGGGGYIKILATAANIGASAAINVGAGGLAGTSGNNAGGAGGNTTIVINGSTWTASGGGGGGGQTSSASAQDSGTAGTGGNATAGANATTVFIVSGTNSGPGTSPAGAGIVYRINAIGGASVLGLPQLAYNSSGNLYGGGASGFQNQTGSNQAGNAGAQGIIIITEFISV